jgi:hypothetical protein
MNDDLVAREYLLATDDSFWEWRDGGDVITWKNGVTIAFRGEAAAVLESLAPRGLPPFSAVVLLLAATRQGWAPNNSEAGILSGMLSNTDDADQRLRVLANVIAGLDLVHALDAELRTPVPAKCALAAMVFEGARWVVAADQAGPIIAAMRDGVGELLEPADVNVAMRGYGPALLMRDLGILSAGLRSVNADAIRLRMATGLTALPTPPEIELPPATTAFNLISSLTDDNELAGLGRVARRLLSSASLPRRLSAEPEQELGGYSDIANRGSLDRLLASELAHDNLTLAVRVAMNEALYLRRESPPSRPLQHRMVLIDSGIRTWGVPRVFAAAAALAFAATLSQRGSISYFRGKRKELAPVELLTRSGIIEHLAALEADLQLADAIPAFLDRLAESTDPVEPILLMTEDGLADEAVQTALRQASMPQLFLATVNRQGRFRMYERHPHGAKLLHEATLDLDELLAGGAKLVDPARSHDLPAIFSVQPFPLYLAPMTNPERTWHVESWGALSVTTDCRLMLWTDKGQGAIQMTDRLPPGKPWWSSPVDEDNCISIVLGSSENLKLVRICRDGSRFSCLPLQSDPVRAVCSHQGVLFGIGKRGISVINMQTGELMERVREPKNAYWVRDRFFRTYDSLWHSVSHDGRAARFDVVSHVVDARATGTITTLFDHPGRDGPMAVTAQGQLVSTTQSMMQRIPHPFKGDVRVLWISPDGRRLKLAPVTADSSSAGAAVMVNVDSLAITRSSPTIFDDRAQQLTSAVPIRHRFAAIGMTDLGYLALKSHRGQILSFRPRMGTAVLAPEQSTTTLRCVRTFEPLASDLGYKLSVARWDDGSQCVLDSRGLLHLRPANRKLPEATLVLSEGELTGWSSDTRAWGRKFFVSAAAHSRHVLAAAHGKPGEVDISVHQFVSCINA